MTPKLNETMRDLIATKLELTQEEVKGAAKKAAQAAQTIPSHLEACSQAQQKQTHTGMCRGKGLSDKRKTSMSGAKYH